MFVHASRSVTIRTRLDRETIRERLSAIAAAGTPPPGGFIEKGHFLGGSVGAEEFDLDFRFASAKNAQTLRVRGRVQVYPDWRVLRIRITSRDPWMHPLFLIVPGAIAALHLAFGVLPGPDVVVPFVVVTAIYAFVNLLYVPDLAMGRVAGEVASAVDGSIEIRGRWVVPR